MKARFSIADAFVSKALPESGGAIPLLWIGGLTAGAAGSGRLAAFKGDQYVRQAAPVYRPSSSLAAVTTFLTSIASQVGSCFAGLPGIPTSGSAACIYAVLGYPLGVLNMKRCLGSRNGKLWQCFTNAKH